MTLLAACMTQTQLGTGDQAATVYTPDATRIELKGSPATVSSAILDAVGRVGPDGAMPIADRGIGGTGAPTASRTADPIIAAPVIAAPVIADRGTGARTALASTSQTADRGIGGTGIVGVVTGFGSIFVDGIEVGYDASAAVDVDGSASSVSALRAGQLVAIQAEGSATSLHARIISVRSAATGRIEALERGSGTLTIAGQAVTVPAGTWGADRFGLGDWVKVSGLRRGDGTIVASRLDAATPGTLLARGQIVRDGDQVRMGNLMLTKAAAATVQNGQFVVVSGDYAAGRGHVNMVTDDTLSLNPAVYFGQATNELVVQAFVRVDKGSLSMNGMKIKFEAIVSGEVRQEGIAVVSLKHQPDGTYTAVGLRYGDYRGHTSRPGHMDSATSTSQGTQRNTHSAVVSSAQPSTGSSGAATNPPVNATDPDHVSTVTPAVQVPATIMSVPMVMHEIPAVAPIVTAAPVTTPIATVTSTKPSDPPVIPSVVLPSPPSEVPVVLPQDAQPLVAKGDSPGPRMFSRRRRTPPMLTASSSKPANARANYSGGPVSTIMTMSVTAGPTTVNLPVATPSMATSTKRSSSASLAHKPATPVGTMSSPASVTHPTP